MSVLIPLFNCYVSQTPPPQAVLGTLWLDTNTNEFKVCTNPDTNTWYVIDIDVSNTPPPNPSIGDLFVNTSYSPPLLEIYLGPSSGWVVISNEYNEIQSIALNFFCIS